MTLAQRVALATLILIVDFATFALPLAACYAAWVIVRRPPSFLRLVLKLYDGAPERA